jgi:putative ABC transport system permease protein
MPDWKGEARAAIAHLGIEPGREESIAEEIAGHLEERYHELRSGGLSEPDAVAAVRQECARAQLEQGLRSLMKQATPAITPGRDEKGSFLAGIGKDLRIAARLLRMNPGFALIAILSLALGIGANAAIFQLIDAVILRTLPVPDPQSLASVPVIHEGRIGWSVARQQELSSAIWDQLKDRPQAFSNLAAWSTERFDLGSGGEARYADGMWVSGTFFETLGVKPALGRVFVRSDDQKGCGIQGAVISYEFWQSQYGGRSEAIGSTVSLDRHPFQIIGVTPPDFSGLEVGLKFDVALPLCSEPVLHPEGAWTNSPTTWWLAVIGRLRPGWGFRRASAELSSISPGIFAATLPPNYDAIAQKSYLRFRFRAEPAATGSSPLRKQFAQPLCLLLAISGLVLLIACANIANLLLVKASARRPEMALRLALGASRSRLIRQLLIESLLLGSIGTVTGAVVAYVLSLVLIGGIGTAQDQIFLSLSPDWRVLLFTTAVGILTCMVFGTAPAVQAANTEPAGVVKTGARGLTAGREGFLLRRGFIISQIAFSFVLVSAALLFVRTFEHLVNLNAGFQQDHVLVAEFDASALKLPAERRSDFQRELLSQVRAVPGVVSAAETAIVPLSRNGWNEFIDIPGSGTQRALVNFNQASSGYFRTLAVPILAGRDFNDSDTPNAPLVAIVSQSFANRYLTAGNPVGTVFGVRQDGGKPDKMYRVVGLVGDTKYRDLREDYGPIVFLPESQDPAPDPDATLLIRSREDTASLISALRHAAAENNANIVLNFSVLRTSILETLGRERLMAELSGFYGALAATLSMIGLYGVMSYTVARRKREVGIRMALGATRVKILRMIVREALLSLAIGLASGTILLITAGRPVHALLYGLKPTDPVTLGSAMAGMIVVAVAASLVPAQRAASLHPIETLRED